MGLWIEVFEAIEGVEVVGMVVEINEMVEVVDMVVEMLIDTTVAQVGIILALASRAGLDPCR